MEATDRLISLVAVSNRVTICRQQQWQDYGAEGHVAGGYVPEDCAVFKRDSVHFDVVVSVNSVFGEMLGVRYDISHPPDCKGYIARLVEAKKDKEKVMYPTRIATCRRVPCMLCTALGCRLRCLVYTQ